jgi:predicted enzyme related to lactoylglutathione lyase
MFHVEHEQGSLDLFILYVADQGRARDFYASVLDVAPSLDVPGMTELPLPGGGRLGLMPEAGIRRLLPGLPEGLGPRAELYLRVVEPQAMLDRALSAGARLLSPLELRGWGERAAYALDPDGHVLAVAEQP